MTGIRTKPRLLCNRGANLLRQFAAGALCARFRKASSAPKRNPHAVTGIRTKPRLLAIVAQMCVANSPRARCAHDLEKRHLFQKGTPSQPRGGSFLEQVTGIEPAYSAWEADTLPLSYTCLVLYNYNTKCARCQVPKRIFLKIFSSFSNFFRRFFLFSKKLRQLCHHNGNKHKGASAKFAWGEGVARNDPSAKSGKNALKAHCQGCYGR